MEEEEKRGQRGVMKEEVGGEEWTNGRRRGGDGRGRWVEPEKWPLQSRDDSGKKEERGSEEKGRAGSPEGAGPLSVSTSAVL